ncbi:MAG: hypothetical protein J5706_04525 [Elusimicrobiales bacterium]|nr:hypothetical protein [Elusimicrobiales bacterium]
MNDIMTLPEIKFTVDGKITANNLAEISASVEAFTQQLDAFSIQTDEDIKQAEKAAKICAEAEKRIKETKEKAVSGDIQAALRQLDELNEQIRQRRLRLTREAKERKDAIRNGALADAEAMLEKALAEMRYRGMDKADIQARLAAAIKGMSSTANMQKALQKEIDAIYDAEQNYDTKMNEKETAVLAVFDKAGEPMTSEEARSLVRQYGLESVEEARTICTQRHAQREQAKAAAMNGRETAAPQPQSVEPQFQPQIMPANKANDPMRRWRIGITFETNNLDNIVKELLALGGENPKWTELK